MTFLAFILSYLLGSIPAGAWFARLRGLDIQKFGSGNTGATNVLRALGWGPALLVALFDISKGILAVLLARLFFDDPVSQALCGAFAVLGHNFSIFLKFRGGKGVATSFGTLILINPLVSIGAAIIGIFCVVVTRLVSAGSVVGAIAALVLTFSLGQPLWQSSIISGLALLLVFQHRSNIDRLQKGIERRFGEKSTK